MSLSIRTNVASLNAQRNLYSTQLSLDSSLSRLSSGFRITKAGDDAAGLGISTKLESQIRSYGQATRNANDGLSVVQASEAALNEQANILTRMRELAMQSGSDGVGNSERGYIDTEGQKLIAELQRISQVTEYNGTKLLDGSAATLDFQVGIAATANDRISLNTLNATTAAAGAPTVAAAVQAARAAYLAAGGGNAAVAPAIAAYGPGPGALYAADSNNHAYNQGGLALVAATGTSVSGGDAALAAGLTTYATAIQATGDVLSARTTAGGGPAGWYAYDLFLTGFLEAGGALTGSAISGASPPAALAAGLAALGGTFSGAAASGGATGGLGVAGLSLASKAGALAALASIDSALETISSNRATLGATGNRLQSAVANIQSFAESLSAANSRIKDVDVAEETSRMSRSQILMQAGISVLAQANQMPQMALKLLG